jgi:serine/threonine protein kinase
VNKPTAFGKYFLLERISVGGMAEVFRAKAFGVEGFERLVAVKRILPNVAEDKEFIRAFIEEAKLAVQLNHANIAQIFDLGVVDGSYYIALEHVHGRDLRGILERGPRAQAGDAGETAIAQACFIAMKVCEGLDYAHNKRDAAGKDLALVHRDVSPQNILVSFEGEVKLIDFGIAKAAGTGPRTSAGILKGKLGYMSPEQVRGLPLDRRSDVFSCGIVLYELLTGERLFTGDTDQAILEKVKNVEILPPSTYNRKIPDELERIVLKALARDPDDRYQNAIDLHDELQAFVYTAGEFYSRKDLAGWMKKAFAQEIEDETAKLESYRQLKPPEPGTVTSTETTTLATATAAGSGATRAPATKRPPRTTSQPVPIVGSPTQPPARSQSVPALQPPARDGGAAVAFAGPSDAVPVPTLDMGGGMVAAQLDPSAVGWEDDEVETQIYADQDKSAKQRPSQHGSLPLSSPEISAVTASSEISLATADIEISDTVQSGVMALSHAPRPHARLTPTELADGTNVPPMHSPSGRIDRRSRMSAGPDDDDDAGERPSRPTPRSRELSAPSRLVSATHTIVDPIPLDPLASFGARITATRRDAERRRAMLLIALGGGAVVAIAGIAIFAFSGTPRPAPVEVAPAAVKPVVPLAADPNTGFDLYVTPSGIMQWKLDGESRTDRLPSRIRGISAGEHTVQIEPLPGFLSQLQHVTVEDGKAPKVEIKLKPIDGIVGAFESTPPGATVSLIVDGKRQALGPSPAKAPLDPRSSYQVLFEKPGYVSVNRPIQISGRLDEHVTVTLERVGAAAPAAPVADSRPRRSTPEPVAAEARGQGILVLGSKPPCEILVDGSSTGLRTPQKEIKLPAGRHRITLVNTEFNIRETFSVDIKADAPEKMIKDYSDRLPH